MTLSRYAMPALLILLSTANILLMKALNTMVSRL